MGAPRRNRSPARPKKKKKSKKTFAPQQESQLMSVLNTATGCSRALGPLLLFYVVLRIIGKVRIGGRDGATQEQRDGRASRTAHTTHFCSVSCSSSHRWDWAARSRKGCCAASFCGGGWGLRGERGRRVRLERRGAPPNKKTARNKLPRKKDVAKPKFVRVQRHRGSRGRLNGRLGVAIRPVGGSTAAMPKESAPRKTMLRGAGAGHRRGEK